MDLNHVKVWIEMDDETIKITNQKGRAKSFPRCGIVNVRSFITEMARSGNLNELIVDY